MLPVIKWPLRLLSYLLFLVAFEGQQVSGLDNVACGSLNKVTGEAVKGKRLLYRPQQENCSTVVQVRYTLYYRLPSLFI